MRTSKEIYDRFQSIKENDFMGTFIQDLVLYMDYEDVLKLSKNGDIKKGFADTPKEKWNETKRELKQEDIIKQIKEYLPFAWEKANNERGLSATRNIEHFNCWLWLIGDTELLEFLEDNDNYAMYGKPILNKINLKYGDKNGN